MPHFAASDLGLHCLPTTLMWVSRLEWVKFGIISRVATFQGNVKRNMEIFRVNEKPGNFEKGQRSYKFWESQQKVRDFFF